MHELHALSFLLPKLLEERVRTFSVILKTRAKGQEFFGLVNFSYSRPQTEQ